MSECSIGILSYGIFFIIFFRVRICQGLWPELSIQNGLENGSIPDWLMLLQFAAFFSYSWVSPKELNFLLSLSYLAQENLSLLSSDSEEDQASKAISPPTIWLYLCVIIWVTELLVMGVVYLLVSHLPLPLKLGCEHLTYFHSSDLQFHIWLPGKAQLLLHR